jgi:hypothetical protein
VTYADLSLFQIVEGVAYAFAANSQRGSALGGSASSHRATSVLFLRSPSWSRRSRSKSNISVPDRRHVDRQIEIVVVSFQIGQVVAAAVGQRAEVPVALDEFHNRGMLGIAVLDMAPLENGRISVKKMSIRV